MRMHYLPNSRRAGTIVLAVILILSFYVLSDFAQIGDSSFIVPFRSVPPPTNEALAALPELAALRKPELPESKFCIERFSAQYLYDLRDHAIQYCSPTSGANLTCFHSHTQAKDERDSFCIGQGAVLNAQDRVFTLDCEVRRPTSNESSHGIIPFDSIRDYWYETGPGFLFQNFVNVGAWASSKELTAQSSRNSRPVTILIKREGHNNIWHSLMEIWSMTMSLDVLRLSRAGDDLRAYFSIPKDIPRTQVVFLDDHEEGPLFSLWGVFAGREPLRLSKILQDSTQVQAFTNTPQDIILPLAGGSNPLWQNDWEERDCRDAPLLKMFIRRVMRHFGVEFKTGPRRAKSLTITLIDRRGSRKLLEQESLLEAARKKFANANFQAIDLGSMPFADQIRIIQSTDVLVGVHGAGLTHTMFLRENGAAVIEIQPSSMSHKGFRNLAQMLGHKYISTHAEMVGAEEEDKKNGKRNILKRDRWHWADVRIEEDDFLELVRQAIDSVDK